MGYLIAAELVPNLLFALHAGAWVDRRGGRRVLMIMCDLGRAAAIATIPLAYAFDALRIQQLYVVAFLVGCMTVLFHVSYSSLFVSIVPREKLRRGELVPGREPRVLVRRRAERRGHPRPGAEGALRAASWTL